MIWNKMFKGFPLLAVASIASACALEVSGLLEEAGGATASGSSSVASAGPSGGGTTSSSAAESTSSSSTGSSSSSASSSSATGGGGGGGGGTGSGCTSAKDMRVLADDKAVNKAAQECGYMCSAKPDCSQDCMVGKTGMSDGCAACWSVLIECAAKSCPVSCGADPNNPLCIKCTTDNCGKDYGTCAKITAP